MSHQAYILEIGSASRSVVAGGTGIARYWTGAGRLSYGGNTYHEGLLSVGNLKVAAGLRIPAGISFELAVPMPQDPGAAHGRIRLLEHVSGGWNTRWTFLGVVARLIAQGGVTIGEMRHLVWWLRENQTAERWGDLEQRRQHSGDKGFEYAGRLAEGGYSAIGVFWPP